MALKSIRQALGPCIGRVCPAPARHGLVQCIAEPSTVSSASGIDGKSLIRGKTWNTAAIAFMNLHDVSAWYSKPSAIGSRVDGQTLTPCLYDVVATLQVSYHRKACDEALGGSVRWSVARRTRNVLLAATLHGILRPT